jgi:hypothetical protein
MKSLIPLIITPLALAGCAALNVGWYKPGMSQQEFAQDRYECMASSQMQVSGAAVNGSATPYYGQVNGAASSYTTTNNPLFSACMQARGYVWTNQAAVEKYEASQNNYQPPPAPYRAPATTPTRSSKSDPGTDAWYDCMKQHNWSDAALNVCERYEQH